MKPRDGGGERERNAVKMVLKKAVKKICIK